MAIETDLLDRAMRLSSGDRADLARQLILSLEPSPLDDDPGQAWEAEIEKRLAALDRGEVTPVAWRDAAERARAALRNDQVR